MKIVFFGTPHFAREILDALLKAGLDVVAIVTRPDKPKGRSLQLQPSPVKLYHSENRLTIPLFQPEKASHPDFVEVLKGFSPDFFVVVGYGEILKQALLDVPKLSPINIHTSLLPTYRGAAPIQRAMMAGEPIMGITVMKMNALMDAGEILLQKSTAVNLDDDFGAVEEKLIQLSKEGIKEVLCHFDRYSKSAKKQDLSLVSHAPKIEVEDCKIDWSKDSKTILHLVKALSPKPSAWTTLASSTGLKRLKILDVKALDEKREKQLLVAEDSRLYIGCGFGSVEVLKLQPEGKGVMSAKDFLNGYKQSLPLQIQ